MFTGSGFTSPPSFVQLITPSALTYGVNVYPFCPLVPVSSVVSARMMMLPFPSSSTTVWKLSPFGPCAPCGPVSPSFPSAPSRPAGPCGPASPLGPAGPRMSPRSIFAPSVSVKIRCPASDTSTACMPREISPWIVTITLSGISIFIPSPPYSTRATFPLASVVLSPCVYRMS